ncbi:DMT family transporter [Vibrio sp. WXL103]|uniref:DMT family transporter n=1 Tax=Vibrio sp. WXL103 TaxID=3450710 RepID=UPI003EC5D8FE
MSINSFLRLVLLAAIWGGSFLFTRIAANTFGPAFLIEFRVGFGLLFLIIAARCLKKQLAFKQHRRHFFTLGLLNTALPFTLFAYAAQTLNASTLSILNSTAAIWGAIIAFFWFGTKIHKQGMIGLLLGISGVAILVGVDGARIGSESIIPIMAGVMAAFSYGLATNYTKKAPAIESFSNAHGSMWAATFWMLPLLLFMPMRGAPSPIEWTSVTLLGIVCTGYAYLLFFRLVSDEGPASALSVTFLIPIFGILWGYLFLDEPIGFNTIAGTILILSGTMMVTGFNPRQLLKKP